MITIWLVCKWIVAGATEVALCASVKCSLVCLPSQRILAKSVHNFHMIADARQYRIYLQYTGSHICTHKICMLRNVCMADIWPCFVVQLCINMQSGRLRTWCLKSKYLVFCMYKCRSGDEWLDREILGSNRLYNRFWTTFLTPVARKSVMPTYTTINCVSIRTLGHQSALISGRHNSVTEPCKQCVCIPDCLAFVYESYRKSKRFAIESVMKIVRIRCDPACLN